MFSGPYGHPLVQTPNLDRLAADGVVFQNAYCNSPLCTPSRMSFMTGRYVHHIGAWDNSAPIPSDMVTWAHRLRAIGYDVVLSGKQHFYGPDQLHGFRAQLARDLHAERHHPIFDWSAGIQEAPQPWGALDRAGPGTTEEIEVDDQVEAAALDYLRDPARHRQPWALNVSFMAPHFPFVVPQRFWDLYPEAEVDMPTIPPGHLDNQHPVYRRLRRMFGMADFSEELVRRGRVGYYGLITYLDEKIGRLLDALEETGQRENTVIAYFSDHGEMAGEHGMWRKSNFYEQSVRVPLQLAWPGQLPGRPAVNGVVSLVDLVATIVEAAGASSEGVDGDSLLALARGEAARVERRGLLGVSGARGRAADGDAAAGTIQAELQPGRPGGAVRLGKRSRGVPRPGKRPGVSRHPRGAAKRRCWHTGTRWTWSGACVGANGTEC